MFTAHSIIFAIATLVFVVLAANPKHEAAPTGLYVGLALLALGHLLP